MNRTRWKRQRGMTLVELSLSLVVIGMLVGGGSYALNGMGTYAARTAAEQDASLLIKQVEFIIYETGFVPCPDYAEAPNGLDGESDCEFMLESEDVYLGRVPWNSMLEKADELNIYLDADRVKNLYYGVQKNLVGEILKDAGSTVLMYRDEFEARATRASRFGGNVNKVNFLCDRIQKSSASGVEHSLKYSTNPVADTCDDSLQPFGPMVVLINPMEDRDQLPANGDNAKFDSINGTLSTCVANPEVNARGDYDDIVRSLDMVTYLGRYCNAASL